MQIWYQSHIDAAENPHYVGAVGEYLNSIADPGTTFEVIGMSPPDRDLHLISEFRCAAHVIRNAVRAQEGGYDAYAVGHFQDAALLEARAGVEIPVLGLGEASMLHACTLGQKIGLVTINPYFIPWHERQIAGYALGGRVVAVRAMETNVGTYMSAMAGDDAALADVRSQFRAQAEPLVEAGVEVIIPAGGLPTMVLARFGLDVDLGGAVVLNGIAVLAKSAELAVKLRGAGVAGASRNGTFALPTGNTVSDFLESMAH